MSDQKSRVRACMLYDFKQGRTDGKKSVLCAEGGEVSLIKKENISWIELLNCCLCNKFCFLLKRTFIFPQPNI